MRIYYNSRESIKPYNIEWYQICLDHLFICPGVCVIRFCKRIKFKLFRPLLLQCIEYWYYNYLTHIYFLKLPFRFVLRFPLIVLILPCRLSNVHSDNSFRHCACLI